MNINMYIYIYISILIYIYISVEQNVKYLQLGACIYKIYITFVR